MEIASYKILVAAAEEAGDTETASVCKAILAEEVAMADWISGNLAKLTQEYLRREETPGTTAKR